MLNIEKCAREFLGTLHNSKLSYDNIVIMN